MRIIIDCDRDRYADAPSLIDQEIVRLGDYDKPGWGWHFNRNGGLFFVRGIKGGISVTQKEPTPRAPLTVEDEMGSRHTMQRHRGRQHRHALARLQERYLPEAAMADVIALREVACGMAKDIKALPFEATKIVFVNYRGHFMRLVYCCRYNAIRTVLPL